MYFTCSTHEINVVQMYHIVSCSIIMRHCFEFDKHESNDLYVNSVVQYNKFRPV